MKAKCVLETQLIHEFICTISRQQRFIIVRIEISCVRCHQCFSNLYMARFNFQSSIYNVSASATHTMIIILPHSQSHSPSEMSVHMHQLYVHAKLVIALLYCLFPCSHMEIAFKFILLLFPRYQKIVRVNRKVYAAPQNKTLTIHSQLPS